MPALRALPFSLCVALLSPVAFGADKKAPPPAKKAEPPARPEPAKNPRRRAPGVRGMFDGAQEAYEAGRYGVAANAYEALLRKYPGHEPAMIQLAKSYYRLERIKEAYAVFGKVNPRHLDPETSYEYGWAFYLHKSWEGALGAFQAVPKGHAFYDLANYYGGICAIKLKRYDDAEDMLEKAVVLPDKLAKSRSLYLRHVQALRLLQQKSQLAQERDQEKANLAARQQAPRKKSKDEKPSEEKPPEAPKHLGLRTVVKAARLAMTQEHQYIDNHATKETSYDVKVPSFELLSGPLLLLPFKPFKDRQPAVGLQLTLYAEDRLSKGEEQRIVIDERNDDLQRLLTKDLGTKDEKSGKWGVEPWIEFPLPENLWLSLGGEVSFKYPEFERGQRTGIRVVDVAVGGRAQGAAYGTSVYLKDILDPKSKPTTKIVGGRVSGWREVLPQLTVGGRLAHEAYDYPSPELEIDGPDSLTKGEFDAVQAFPYGFAIKVVGGLEQATNQIFYDLPTFGAAAADGFSYSGMAVLTYGAVLDRLSFPFRPALPAGPVPFLEASVAQLVRKTEWKLDNPEVREVFEYNVADYVERFTATISLNMDF